MVRQRLAAGILCLAALASAGCASKPTMHLHHAELRSASFYGVGLDVVLKVHNPNSYDVQVRNVNVRVVIGGRYTLPPVIYSPNQWLPAGENTYVRVPMLIPYQLIPRLLQETVSSPVIQYRVQGIADVTATRLFGVQRDNFPVDEMGSVGRRDLAMAAGMAW